jgi:hypothetical protein
VDPCRKCGTPNPPSNQYCRKCGAVLAVATALVRAQPRTLIPLPRGFRWRWVALGALVILGTATLVLAATFVAGTAVLGSGLEGGSLRGLGAGASGFVVAAGAALLVAFFLGGWLTSRLSRVRRVAEAAIAALAVLVFLAVAGAALSTDLVAVAAALALPCVAAAGLGGRLGAPSGGHEEVRS